MVNKEINFPLFLHFLFRKIRGFSDFGMGFICKLLVYSVLICSIFTPKIFRNFSSILEAEFFLVENSK